MGAKATTVVVTDANVLINFAHIGQLSMFGALEGYHLQVPTDVIAEIVDDAQRAAVIAAIAAGHLEQVTVDTIEAIALFAELRAVMGRGEASCLALAATTGAHVASDEKKRFRRYAIELLGEEYILRTESLLLHAIRQGRITVADADAFKAKLEAHRYVMPFISFAEHL
jgi:predicted nucleic acid-binding protein